MFHLSNHWMLFVLDASAKAILLAMIAGVTLKILNLRNPNVQHRVWVGVLVGMLSVPVLATILPAIPISIPGLTKLSIGATPDDATLDDALDDALDDVGRKETGETGSTVGIDRRQSSDRNEANEHSTTPAADLSPSEVAVAQDRPSKNASPSQTESRSAIAGSDGRSRPAEAGVAASSKWDFASMASLLTGTLFVFWCLVSAYFSLRLIVGLVSSARIRRRSVSVQGWPIQHCLEDLPSSLSRWAPTIRESKEVLVPVTVGWWRPTVLLPQDWRAWPLDKLTAIVAHEFTHIARRDFGVALAAELNRCLYWFHPVSWWLRSHLSDLAEEACDDAAIGYTGDRTGYARHLLEVASSLTKGCGRRVQPGMSMARESNVESRIATILDFKRPLSGRLTPATAAVIGLIALSVIAIFSSIHPVLAHPDSTDTDTAAEDDSSKAANDEESIRIHGQATDSDGRPIAAARVRVYHSERSSWYAANADSTLVLDLKADENGKFDKQVASSKLAPTSGKSDSWAVLVVSAPGFAPTIMHRSRNYAAVTIDGKSKPDFLKGRVVVKLRAEVTLRGRILSLEGQPIEDAEVSAFQISRSDPKRLGAWLKQTGKVPSSNDAIAMLPRTAPSQEQFFPAEERMHVPPSFAASVRTGRDGVFELRGLVGKDDLAVLRIRGEGITNATVHVLAREMKPVYGRHTTNFSHSGAYYGTNFDLIAQPSQPVFGVVRDIETKKPIPGISVAVGGVYGATMSHTGYIVTKTDDKGQYRIEGLPIAPPGTRRYRGNSLAVRVGDLPYIENDTIPIPAGDGLSPIEFDIQLRRGVLAKGRVTDTSGEPIVAEIYYAPFLTNDHVSKYIRYADDLTMLLGNTTRYYSDDDGNFAIPVIPGRGVVAVKATKGGYVTSFGAKNIKEFRDHGAALGGRITSDHLVPSLYHSLKEIDAPTDATEFSLAIQVDQGRSLKVKYIDPEGQPIQGVMGRGLSSERRVVHIEGDESEATGLVDGEVRPLYFYNKDRSLIRYARLVPEEGQTEFTVQLFPPTRVTGRLLDLDGRPVAKANLQARHQNNPEFMGSEPDVAVKENGDFEYYLPVGTTYKIVGRTDKYFYVADNVENQEPRNIDLGELVLDPDADRWSHVKPKGSPKITPLK